MTSGAQQLAFHLMLLARGNFVTVKPFLNDESNDYRLSMAEEQQAVAKKMRVVGLMLGVGSVLGLAKAPRSTAAAWAVRKTEQTTSPRWWKENAG